MKLEDWLKPHSCKAYPNGQITCTYVVLPSLTKGLSVMGTCGGEQGCEKDGQCLTQFALKDAGYQHELKDFGCIHWEPRKQ